jgi:hypothetical protein
MSRPGPRQVWTWSRIDGSVKQHRVRPSVFDEGCWVEEWGNECSWGWQQWPEAYLCNSPEEAARQARDHFQRIISDAQMVLARIA